MEEEFTLISSASYEQLLEYFSNPKNIMDFIPFFKEIKEIDKNVYIVKIGWIFNLQIKVFKIVSKNRITYLVEHTSFPRIISKLDHVIESAKERSDMYEIKVSFYYRGPFERLVKNQARKLYEVIKDKFSVGNISSSNV